MAKLDLGLTTISTGLASIVAGAYKGWMDASGQPVDGRYAPTVIGVIGLIETCDSVLDSPRKNLRASGIEALVTTGIKFSIGYFMGYGTYKIGQ